MTALPRILLMLAVVTAGCALRPMVLAALVRLVPVIAVLCVVGAIVRGVIQLARR